MLGVDIWREYNLTQGFISHLGSSNLESDHYLLMTAKQMQLRAVMARDEDELL